jgi:Fe-S cluster assembly protein SufD
MPGVAVYESAFSELEPSLKKNGPAWLHALRREGMDNFRALGFPSLREEDWRFTRTRPIAEVDFRPAPAVDLLDPRTVAERTFDDAGCMPIHAVNGRVMTPPTSGLPQGVWIGSLARAWVERDARLREVLSRGVDIHRERFAALNTAFLSDGFYIEIADDTEVEKPIHVVHTTVPGKAPAMTHPRLVVVTGRNAKVAVVESYITSGDGAHFTNVVSEFFCGENATVHHWKVQRESPQAFHIGLQHAIVGTNGRFNTLNVTMGGALVRNDVRTILDGEGIDVRVDGLYVAGGRQHVDNHTFIRHAKPHGHSFEQYKGVLDGHARGVFNGKIYVDPQAQKTDAKQENNCMLLSDDARVNTNPQLEIFADDVKCTHGAAIGKTDDEALFYLRSRGVPGREARDLMVYAFASEVLERIDVEPLKRRLEDDLFAWLRSAQAARA